MIKFGTGGWRAIIGDEFTKTNIQTLAKAMADKMRYEGVSEKGIVIGYDRRFLAKEAVVWSCEVLAAAGLCCYFINRSVPTPLVMYYVMKHQFPYGMMVTASHNPALYNGIKVFTAGGRDANEEQTKDIEGYIEKINPDEIETMDYNQALAEGFIKEIYPMNEYLDNILDKIDMQAIKGAHLKVALDTMHGVGEVALSTVLISGRCDLEVINKGHDTLFGRKMPAPSENALKDLENLVKEKHFDVGIATDGDADRLGVIDDEGNYLHPNDILVLLYFYLKKYKKWNGPVVRNIATTHRLNAIAEKYREVCYEVPVGFKHISSKMRETGAILGGESSGGLTVVGHINGKDGVYAAALLIEMLAVTGKKLSELIRIVEEECGTLYMVEDSYSFTEQVKQSLMKRLFEDKDLPNMQPYEVKRISYEDGCKVYFTNGGWIIARFSGTEPLLRIFCEMPTKKEAAQMSKLFQEYYDL